ncbi:hypothetical protein HQ590_01905 [bacterium]|nr:hypothetical protein [bacterium]
MTYDEISRVMKLQIAMPEGLSRKQIARWRLERRRSRAWAGSLSGVPHKLLLSAEEAPGLSEADATKLTSAMMKLRQESLAGGGGGDFTMRELAKELGMNHDAFYERRSWLKFCQEQKRKLKKEHLQVRGNADIDHAKDLEAQGLNVTGNPEKASTPDGLPENYGQVAQPHRQVINAYEREELSRAELVSYLEGLPKDELWALKKVLKEEGVSDGKLYAMGFPRPKLRSVR